jgi:hypothetical protein
VTFESTDPDLPGGDGHTEHVYLRNLDRSRTRLIDRNSKGEVAEEDGYAPSVSGNGRFVVFGSYADNLPDGDGTHSQLYRRNVRRGNTRLVSRNNDGDAVNGTAYAGNVSAGGRYVAFAAQGANFPGKGEQAYARDMRRGRTILLSRAASGAPARYSTYSPPVSISLDGRWAGFYSDAENLGGSPHRYNVYRAGVIR